MMVRPRNDALDTCLCSVFTPAKPEILMGATWISHLIRRVLQVGRSRRCASMEARPSLRHAPRQGLLQSYGLRNDRGLLRQFA